MIRLLDTDDKTATYWTSSLCNACTRISHLIKIMLGGKDKWAQFDETHWFKVPKRYRVNYRKYRNWLFVVVCRKKCFMHCQLVRKRTRLALETPMFNTLFRAGVF